MRQHAVGHFQLPRRWRVEKSFLLVDSSREMPKSTVDGVKQTMNMIFELCYTRKTEHWLFPDAHRNGKLSIRHAFVSSLWHESNPNVSRAIRDKRCSAGETRSQSWFGKRRRMLKILGLLMLCQVVLVVQSRRAKKEYYCEFCWLQFHRFSVWFQLLQLSQLPTRRSIKISEISIREAIWCPSKLSTATTSSCGSWRRHAAPVQLIPTWRPTRMPTSSGECDIMLAGNMHVKSEEKKIVKNPFDIVSRQETKVDWWDISPLSWAPFPSCSCSFSLVRTSASQPMTSAEGLRVLEGRSCDVLYTKKLTLFTCKSSLRLNKTKSVSLHRGQMVVAKLQ